MREFIDQDGRMWTAYTVGASVHGIELSRLHLPDQFKGGWLAIECGDQKLRIAPVPPGWADMTDEELCALLAKARTA